jgi:hypothetical protein
VKAKKIRGSVQFIYSLGWCLLACEHAVPQDQYPRRPQKRQYWLVDWSKAGLNPVPGIWEAITGDFTERYHEDWCRPVTLVQKYEEEAWTESRS